MADVSHVGGASVFPWNSFHGVEPEALQALLEETGQDDVVSQVGVGILVESEIDTTSGGKGRRLEDVLHFLDELLHIGLVPSADQELTSRSLGHDVGRRATFDQEAMQAGTL